MSESISGALISGLTIVNAVNCRTKAYPKKGKAKTVKLVQPKEEKMLKNGGFGDKKMKEPLWECVQNCGACCKLQKDPSFASPDEIFDNPHDVQLYNSLVGTDGWCIHYDKINRKCSIYDERPYFCRVETDVFQTLYGISKRKFNKEACSFCNDTIKAIYGADSEELNRFNKAVRS
ncbi:hypothetical protein RND81_11G139500 [Saponaria officinalis]|uniref:Uncharacterized protein n=1 Tax=Saponaria officinalis TaxID=3572 RepID=A0AAW1HNJ8_SAPOF